jgi:hypothetical protein
MTAFRLSVLRAFPIIRQLPHVAPILIVNVLDHDVNVFGLFIQDANETVSDLANQLRFLLTRRARGDLHVDVRHDW